MTPSASNRNRSAARAIALPRPAPAGAGIADAIEQLKAILHRIAEAYRTRQARRASIQKLNALSDHTLKDIGIHRSEIVSLVEAGGRGERRRRYAGR